MNLLSCLAILLIAMSGAAAAETPDTCAGIKTDAERLLCYDLLFRKASNTSTNNEWKIETDVSKVDDTKNVFISVKSKDVHQKKLGAPSRFDFLIMCRERKTMMFITFAGEYMSDFQGRGTVTSRTDKNPATRTPMVVSTDNEALGLTGADAIRYIKTLLGSSNLFIRATPVNSPSVDAEFNISGIADAIAPLRSACSW